MENSILLYKTIFTVMLVIPGFSLRAQHDNTVFRKGVITDTVTCLANHADSYSLFLPENYDASRKWPVILIFDPAARGRTGIENFVPAGRKYGYILACSHNVRNGDFTIMLSEAGILYNDIVTRFKTDSKRIFTAGFSGGSRLATAFSVENKEIAGVIGCGAGLPNISYFQPSLMRHLIYFGIVGNKDMNFQEMHDLARLLESSGVKSFFLVFSGLHTWPSAGDLELAVGWLEVQMMKNGITRKNEDFLKAFFQELESKAKESEIKSDIVTAHNYYKNLLRDFPDLSVTANIEGILEKIEKSDAYKKEIRDQEKIHDYELAAREKYLRAMYEYKSDKELNDSIFNWWRHEINSLNSRTKSKRVSDSLVAFRLINIITVASAENGSNCMSTGSYKLASMFFTIWTICEPDRKNSWYSLARAYAFNGQNSKSIEALTRSIKEGLNNKLSVINDPAFAKILNDKRFKKLADSMK